MPRAPAIGPTSPSWTKMWEYFRGEVPLTTACHLAIISPMKCPSVTVMYKLALLYCLQSARALVH